MQRLCDMKLKWGQCGFSSFPGICLEWLTEMIAIKLDMQLNLYHVHRTVGMMPWTDVAVGVRTSLLRNSSGRSTKWPCRKEQDTVSTGATVSAANQVHNSDPTHPNILQLLDSRGWVSITQQRFLLVALQGLKVGNTIWGDALEHLCNIQNVQFN
jgi:hypothetical protein